MTATITRPRFDPVTMRSHLALLGLPAAPEDVAEREVDRRIVEVRVLDASCGVVAAGYFSSCEALEKSVKPWALHPDVDAIFVTLNEPVPSLLARYENHMQPPTPRERSGKLVTTSDKDIRRRRLMVIDIDVERPAGISASDEERAASAKIGSEVYRFLRGQGVAAESMTTMSSGNGHYILLAVDLPNDDASRDLCKSVLEALAARFDTAEAHIDRTTFNASRIAALCGTLKGKGDDTRERPHRMVAPIHNGFPLALVPVEVEVLERIGAPAIKPKGKTMGDFGAASPGGLGPFPMEEFIARHPRLNAGTRQGYRGGDRWQIDCPFDENHKTPDAILTLSADGAPGFKCSHDSCVGRDMKALCAHLGDAQMLMRFEQKSRQTTDKNDKKGSEGVSVVFVSTSDGESADSYPEFDAPPRALHADLAPVPSLPAEMLPPALRDWLWDTKERVGCPLEYPAAAALVALGAVIGRRVGIRPKQHDDWTVAPNLWGAIVGRPGTLKSPAVAEALMPLNRLEEKARTAHQVELENFHAGSLVAKARAEAAKAELKKEAAKSLPDEERLRTLAVDAMRGERDPEPTAARFTVNDCTVEALAERLRENPNGLLVFRDELPGLLRGLERQGHEQDRAFYLESWNGTGSFTTDRIGRGTIHIPSVTLSLFGGIQPGPLAAWLRGSAMGEASDGFVSRLQILFWPDPPGKFRNVDRWPNPDARAAALALFEKLASLTAESVGAQVEEGGIPYLRFAFDAQPVFDAWRIELEDRINAGQDTPMMLEHLAKYRSLLPSLALIFHLAETGAGPVSLAALEYAKLWVELLEVHARRLYQSVLSGQHDAAALLSERLKPNESLPNPFTPRHIQRKGWAGLSTAEEVDRALGLLEDRGWLASREVQSVNEKGYPQGRPTTLYYRHPSLLQTSGSAAGAADKNGEKAAAA